MIIKNIILISSLFFTYFLLKAQWVIQDTLDAPSIPLTPAEISITGISFPTSDTGYYFYYYDPPTPSTMSNMIIKKTIDGGHAWYNVLNWLDYSYILYEAFFTSADTGFFLMNHYAMAILEKTTDGGVIWNSVGGTNLRADIFFTNGSKGYALNYYGVFFKYDNDTLIITDTITIVNCYNSKMFFTSNGIGYVLCIDTISGSNNFNSIIRTTDDGYTWTIIFQDISLNLNDIYFPSDSIGYVVCDSGLILKTTDAGTSWSQINTNFSYTLCSVSFINTKLGYVVGQDGLILKTIDGGLNWQQQNSPANIWFTYVTFINDSIGYILGRDYKNILFKTTNGGETGIKSIEENLYFNFKLFPNPSMGILTVKLSDEIKNVSNNILSVYNSFGSLIWQKRIEQQKDIIIDISSNSKGIYLVKLNSVTNYCTKKIIIE